MNNTTNDDILTNLLAQIDRGWADHKDRTIIDRLSREYPEFAQELQDFFADLILGSDEEVKEDFSEAENSVHAWIVTSGMEIASTARNSALRQATSTATGSHSPPLAETAMKENQKTKVDNAGTAARTWIALLRQKANVRLPKIASELPHVSTEYLVLVSRHPTVVPTTAKQKLARFVEERFGVREQESLACLSEVPPLLRAASRSTPFEQEPASFRQLLDRAALTPEDKQFWLIVAEQPPSL